LVLTKNGTRIYGLYTCTQRRLVVPAVDRDVADRVLDRRRRVSATNSRPSSSQIHLVYPGLADQPWSGREAEHEHVCAPACNSQAFLFMRYLIVSFFMRDFS
jgi:hypothetical protein